jgi:hypothetical protein
MSATATAPWRKPTTKAQSRLFYDLSIYCYEDEDILPQVLRIFEGFGFRVTDQRVSTMYVPQSGLEIFTADLRLTVPPREEQRARAKAHQWIDAFEAICGGDVRFAQSSPSPRNAR